MKLDKEQLWDILSGPVDPREMTCYNCKHSATHNNAVLINVGTACQHPEYSKLPCLEGEIGLWGWNGKSK